MPTRGQLSFHVYKTFPIYPTHHTTTIQSLNDYIRVYNLGGPNANLNVYYSFVMPYDYKISSTVYFEVILYGSHNNMLGQYVMLGLKYDGGSIPLLQTLDNMTSLQSLMVGYLMD